MIILDDLADKIQSILSDEESMRQIKELADMLKSDGADFSGNTSASSDTYFNNQNTSNNNNNNDDDSGFDFGSLLGGIDLGSIMQLMAAFTSSDKNSDLLLALKPHLSDEKQQKVDKAIKMLKIYNMYLIIKENGMLNDLDKLF